MDTAVKTQCLVRTCFLDHGTSHPPPSHGGRARELPGVSSERALTLFRRLYLQDSITKGNPLIPSPWELGFLLVDLQTHAVTWPFLG
jgi:hypothetical protein